MIVMQVAASHKRKLMRSLPALMTIKLALI